ncbi:type IV pilus assembly protein PilM [Vibrio sp. ZSDE26]|uniref:Type IV pilus assembly protein PilM n=1 Tax=Vibrio amylolyticus TaxID=2847292 RepID=A0A9X1XLP8_9VIBR|nr:type IV pilus assembly protein PilM [Vibrio amylolyticus]MCK6263170.1 type IV pilus assembly protein PilM [Vibrio amylolyticus]
MGKSLITGIDIGHYSIKAVVLKPASEGYSLVSFKELPISASVFSDNHSVDHQEIVKKLTELRKSLPLFSRRVAMSIPDNAVISKVLRIDNDLDERETEFAIYQAFSHQSPFAIEDLSLDFVKVDDSSKTPTVAYQVYATKREVVDSRYAAAKKAGFTPVLFDAQAHSLVSLWQLMASQTGSRNWLLADIGYTQTSLCMDFINTPPFCKDIALGTQFMDQESSSMNSLLENRAEQFIPLMIERLQRQLQMLMSMKGTPKVAGIWLSGGGATTSMLVDEIERKLGIECQLFNPFNLFRCTSSRKLSRRQALSLQQESNRFSTAAGIAIRANDWLEASDVS